MVIVLQNTTQVGQVCAIVLQNTTHVGQICAMALKTTKLGQTCTIGLHYKQSSKDAFLIRYKDQWKNQNKHCYARALQGT